jgi:hypothetical protein
MTDISPAEDRGYFRAHRNNTKGTAHRRFAISNHLNADFEGGEVRLSEYGPRNCKAPPGGAVVFSHPLLHEVSRVTKGRRYAFLHSCMTRRRQRSARPTISFWASRSAPAKHSTGNEKTVSYNLARLLTLTSSGAFVLIAAVFFGLAAVSDLATRLGLGLAMTITGWSLVWYSIRAVDRIAQHDHPLADPRRAPDNAV